MQFFIYLIALVLLDYFILTSSNNFNLRNSNLSKASNSNNSYNDSSLFSKNRYKLSSKTALSSKSTVKQIMQQEQKLIHKDLNTIIGESYTTEDHDNIYATTFTFAQAPYYKEGTYSSDYKTPQTVSHLSEEVTPPNKGPLEVVEENSTVGEYYDGSLNLNKIIVNCSIIVASSDCVHQSGCGWCGSTKSCIFGTKYGPLQKCLQSSYIGGTKYPNQGSVNYKKVNETVGLVTSTIIGNGN